MKVALVHDWLTGMRGGERVLEVLCELFPEAPLYTLFHFPGSTSSTIENRKIFTSFLQKFPKVSSYYRYTYPLMPIAIETFDLAKYDLVISTSNRIAKGVVTPPHTCHISYIHTPMRDAWEMVNEYFGKEQMNWWKRLVIPPQLTYLRLWDQLSTPRVNYLIANSKNVQERIKHIYNRDSTVIYPPVEAGKYNKSQKTESGEQSSKEDFYLMVGSFEPDKRVPLAIEAFNKLGYTLKIVSGTGRGHEKILKSAQSNIEFLGWRSDEEVADLFARAKAFIFPGVDDFGITPLEAQAAGTPVVAFAEGGALETVIEGETGVFFKEPTADSLAKAVKKINAIQWNKNTLKQNAQRFNKERFKNELERFILSKYEEYNKQISK